MYLALGCTEYRVPEIWTERKEGNMVENETKSLPNFESIDETVEFFGEKPKHKCLGLQPAQWVSCGIKAFPLGEAGFCAGKAKYFCPSSFR
ncbi:MAG: hypothetical protein GY797_35175 [Deltaproteobacteria bacterium]|nr:hypothetical protein [Deltaproteobacteria bacterium]